MKKINTPLSVVLLDDDEISLLHLKQLVLATQMANVVAIFNNSVQFIREFPRLYFDLLMLDIEMPGISGEEVIKKVGNERCIVNTASKQRYEEAIKCHPIDILIKPVNEIYFNNALEKAQKLLVPQLNGREYYRFRVSDSPDKLNIRIKDIMYVTTHRDPRNKVVLLRDGVQHILMDYKMDKILQIAPHLLQPNYSELVSADIIASRGYDHINLTLYKDAKKEKMIVIGRSFMKKFNLQFNEL